jgi:predicted Zn-dependent peptidase
LLHIVGGIVLKKIVFFLLLSIVNNSYGSEPQKYLGSSIEQLENGISLIFADTSKSDSVLVMFCVSAGNTDETEKEGVSNLLSKITQKKLNDNASNLHYGSECSLYAGHDSTAYYFYTKHDHIEGIIKNFGEICSNFSFSKKDFDECKRLVEQELATDDQVDRIITQREARRSLYWHSKYGSEIAGESDSIKFITDDDIRKFNGKNYKNGRINIIVAGNVDKKEIADLVNKYFVKKGAAEDDKIVRLKEPSHHGSSTRIIKYSSQISVPVIEMYWRIPNYREEKENALATEIYIYALEELLRDALIEKQKIASSMSFQHSFWNYNYGDFCVTVTAENNEQTDDLIRGLISEIKCISLDGITQNQAIEAMEKLLKSSYLVGNDMIDAMDCISKRIASCNDFNFVTEFANFAKKNYNLQLINEQAKKIFKHDPSVISIVIPEKYRKK